MFILFRGSTWMVIATGTICVFTFILYASYYIDQGSGWRRVSSLIKNNYNHGLKLLQGNEIIYTTQDVPTAGSCYVAGFTEPRHLVCPKSGEGVRLLVIVISAPPNYKARMAIRETWGHFTIRTDVAIAFLMGLSREDAVEKSLADEGDLYADIIRARFYENYNNLTLKSISMMEWVAEYCPKAKFLLKSDDDMYINMPKLLAFVDEHVNKNNAIFGRIADGWKPIRNNQSKYYVSQEQYGPKVFPKFATGPAYLLPAVLAKPLYETSLNASFLKLEDVFMTGIVAESLQIERIGEAGFTNERIPLDACSAMRVISIHMVEYHEQFDLWKKLSDGKSKCA